MDFRKEKGGTTIGGAATAPSFERATTKFKGMIRRKGGRKIVTIKAQDSLAFEPDEEIHEEEAVCKFCFDILVNGNLVKLKCSCKNALAHSACASNQFRSRGNHECEVCDQEVEEVPVTLLTVPVAARDNEPKESWIAKLKRTLICGVPQESQTRA